MALVKIIIIFSELQNILAVQSGLHNHVPRNVSVYHAFGDCTVDNWLPFTGQQSRTECLNC